MPVDLKRNRLERYNAEDALYRLVVMSEAKLAVGDRVRVVALPSYVKTAEPMPMLRPPSVIQIGEEGIVLDRRPGSYWGVRFAKGAFLMEPQYLEVVSGEGAIDRAADQ